MKKILFILSLLVSVLNVNGHNYLTLGGGGFFQTNGSEYKCFMIRNSLGHFITPRQSLECEFSMEFPKEEELSSMRIGINYLFHKYDFVFFKVGVGYKQYRCKTSVDKKHIIPGCDIKLGLGFIYNINDKFGIILGGDMSNMLSWHYLYENSFENLAIEPYIGFRANF